MELMELKSGVCKKAQLPLQSSSSQSLACEKAADLKETKEAQPRRELKVQISDVSLDSHGFPLMLSSPKEQEEKNVVVPKKEFILEKQGARQRKALQEAAEQAASRLAKPETRPDVESVPEKSFQISRGLLLK